MNPEKRIREYAELNFNEVYHCTLNPDGPDAPNGCSGSCAGCSGCG